MAYSISEVAKKIGISSYTLRYYDKEGLLPFVKRDAAGRRRFSDDDLDFLDMINCMKTAGMTLSAIREYVDWCGAGDATLPDRLALFQKQKKVIEANIAQQQANLKEINYKIKYFTACCDAGTEAAVSGDCDLPDLPVWIDNSLRKAPIPHQ